MNTCVFTQTLNTLREKDYSAAGGKATQLARMMQYQLPVPQGFVLLTNAYERYLQANALYDSIDNLLKAVERDEPSSKELFNQLYQLFIEGRIPAELVDAIEEKYLWMRESSVAVRSSATAEDLPDLSFAGQYSSFLNVQGKEALCQAVKQCWASLWNERSVAYRIKHKISHKNVAQGVIVQRLVDAEKSGVIFTAHPVNGRRDQMLISSSWGLGDAIVSGDVDPDQWVIHKHSGETLEEYIATKKVKTIRTENGVKLTQVSNDQQTQTTLNQKERKKLFALAQQVEKYANIPQDIEWVYEKGEFYLVQTRAITTLFPMPEPADNDGRLHVYLNVSLYNGGMQAPFTLTPLGLDLIQQMYNQLAKRCNRFYAHKSPQWNKSAGSRLMVDITELLKLKRIQHKIYHEATYEKDPETMKILQELLEREKDFFEQSSPSSGKLMISILRAIKPGILFYLISATPRMIYGTRHPDRVISRATSYGEHFIEKLTHSAKQLKNREDMLRFIVHQSPDAILLHPVNMMFYGIKALGNANQARKILSTHQLDPQQVNQVEKAVPHCVTTNMGIEMLKLAQYFDETEQEMTATHPRIIAFLEQYGHRSIEELDVGISLWKEDPQTVLDILKTYRLQKTYQHSIPQFYKDRIEADRAIKDIGAQLKVRRAHKTARKVTRLLQDYRWVYGIRELPKFYLLKSMELFRTMLLEIGSELHKEGKLENTADIFMLTFDDLMSDKHFEDIVRQNKEKYQREMKRTSVPRVMTNTGEAFYWSGKLDDEEGFTGIPVSPGCFEGVVKILAHPGESYKLEKGDIMVTSSTHPAWTPLFFMIGGLIMEVGGPLSHGSVVAREYGIPAVVGVKEAMRRLKDGQRVRINGATGKIDILSESSENT